MEYKGLKGYEGELNMSENIVDEKDVANVISFMEYFNFNLVRFSSEELDYVSSGMDGVVDYVLKRIKDYIPQGVMKSINDYRTIPGFDIRMMESIEYNIRDTVY